MCKQDTRYIDLSDSKVTLKHSIWQSSMVTDTMFRIPYLGTTFLYLQESFSPKDIVKT